MESIETVVQPPRSESSESSGSKSNGSETGSSHLVRSSNEDSSSSSSDLDNSRSNSAFSDLDTTSNNSSSNSSSDSSISFLNLNWTLSADNSSSSSSSSRDEYSSESNKSLDLDTASTADSSSSSSNSDSNESDISSLDLNTSLSSDSSENYSKCNRLLEWDTSDSIKSSNMASLSSFDSYESIDLDRPLDVGDSMSGDSNSSLSDVHSARSSWNSHSSSPIHSDSSESSRESSNSDTVTPNPDEETANRISACKELYPHMHWFGNMFYDQRLHDIKKVFSPETADDRSDTILERFSDVFTASHTANKLELVNLEFIMDQKYFEGAGRDLIARKPHPDIRNYSERLVDEEGMEFGTIFPTDDVSQLVSNVLAYRDEAEKREQIFTTIHQFILNHTPWEMVEVDDYFVRLILGTPLPESDQNLHAVTPNYNSVMARWAVLPEYMEIKNMKAKDKRPIYGGVGNKIYRSKAVGIFRHMIEVAIKAKVAGFPGFPDISVFRGEPSFKLTEPVSSRSLSDYVISVKNPMTGA